MDKFQNKLKQLKDKDRLRSLNLPSGIDLTSNDYLGMREHPALRAAAIDALESGIEMGAGGSRLLRGHDDHFAALEDFSAKHFGSERALYFANGFAANYALFTTLPDRHDVVIFDSLVHASVRDGIAASHARSIKVAHNDLNDFDAALAKARAECRGQIWVAVESVYSMDGDRAPLAELQNLCRRYDAVLIIDEAHATGVFGRHGEGLAAALDQDNVIALHTCGKAVGVAGGIVCAAADIIDYLINAARPFIYSTAPPPLQAHLTLKSLEILSGSDGAARRVILQERLGFARSAHFLDGMYAGAQSQIIPIILGEDARAVNVANALQAEGFDIRAIRPPTVPEGQARLRLALSANIDEGTLQKFSNILLPHLQAKAA